MLKDLTIIGIFTVITVFGWIGFTIHHNLTTSQISVATQARVEMIPATFDQEAINLLHARKPIPVDLSTSASIKGATLGASLIPTPQPTKTINLNGVESTPSPQLSPTP